MPILPFHVGRISKTKSRGKVSTTTEWVTDLDKRSEMIIFDSILTTFKASIIFRGSWAGSIVNWLEPKIDPLN